MEPTQVGDLESPLEQVDPATTLGLPLISGSPSGTLWEVLLIVVSPLILERDLDLIFHQMNPSHQHHLLLQAAVHALIKIVVQQELLLLRVQGALFRYSFGIAGMNLLATP